MWASTIFNQNTQEEKNMKETFLTFLINLFFSKLAEYITLLISELIHKLLQKLFPIQEEISKMISNRIALLISVIIIMSISSFVENMISMA